MKPATITDQDKAEIVRDYLCGWDQQSLAYLFNTSKIRIRAILVSAGVDIEQVSRHYRNTRHSETRKGKIPMAYGRPLYTFRANYRGRV